MTKSRQVLLRLDPHMDDWLIFVSDSKGISKQELLKAMISDYMVGDSNSRLDDISSDSKGDSKYGSGDSTELADIKHDVKDIKDDIDDIKTTLSLTTSSMQGDIDSLSSRTLELESTILELRSIIESSKPKRGRPRKQPVSTDVNRSTEGTSLLSLIPDSDSL